MELIAETKDGVVVLTLVADNLNAGNTSEFKKLLIPHIQPGVKMVLDLGALKFMDSSGLGTLLSCLRQVNSAPGDLKLSGLAKPIRALFELGRLNRVFELFDSADEAVKSYA